MPTAPSAALAVPVNILLVDNVAMVAAHERPGFTITTVNTRERAIRLLERSIPHVLAVELTLPDGDGLDVCQAMSSRQSRSYVLVTTGAVDRVPAALRVGCDAVLVKPFEPNLLFTRIGRLLRSSGLSPKVLEAKWQLRPGLPQPAYRGTNRVWPYLECPSCHRVGAVSFDYTSYRRMWCACLQCNHVWLAQRYE